MYVCMYVRTEVGVLPAGEQTQLVVLSLAMSKIFHTHTYRHKLKVLMVYLMSYIHTYIHTYIHFITSFSNHGVSCVPDNDQQRFLQYIIIWAGRSGIQQPTYTGCIHIHTYIHTYILQYISICTAVYRRQLLRCSKVQLLHK